MSATPSIILSMIVKNESRIIERCLDAALPFVDGFVIVDTGSTDDTIERIKKTAAKHSVRGVVSHDEWVNFGHNRTRAAKLTRDYAKERGFRLDDTYMLCLDADMVLRDAGFRRTDLGRPSYALEQRCGDMRWANTRLCRLDHEWVAVGVTHEFWRAFPDAPPTNLSTLYIDDRDDGGSKGDKATRDIELLAAEIERNPRDERSFFYLAQSYYGIGRYEDAIEAYTKRIELGGWDEEIWYSQFRIGLCYVKLNDESKAVAELLKAYDMRPSRAEPLAELARFLRIKRTSATAYMLAEKALATPAPGDMLFVETSANTTTPLEEMSILAFYVGKKREGELATEKLLATRGYGDGTYYRAANNLLYYKEPVIQKFGSGTFDVPVELRTFGGTTYLPSSPSFVTVRGKTYVTVRLVNYTQERGRWYVSMDPDGKIRTENVVAEFDPLTGKTGEFRLSRTELMCQTMKDHRILGMEDQRWTEHAGKVVFSATTLDIAGFEDEAQVVVGSEFQGAEGMPLKFRATPITWEGASRCEKNWLPFSSRDDLLFVYGYDPFTVLKVDPETGSAVTLVVMVTKTRMARWRGSAAPVKLGDGRIMMLVHEVVHRYDGAESEHNHVYLHRFVELDSLFPVRYSEAFSFDHHGIEYAAGMLPYGKDVIVGYSYEDRESRWTKINLDQIKWLEVEQ